MQPQRQNTTVEIGMGSISKERRMIALEQVMAKQNELVANGGMGTMVQPFQIYESLRDMTEAYGLQPQAYFSDPRFAPPPPPPGGAAPPPPPPPQAKLGHGVSAPASGGGAPDALAIELHRMRLSLGEISRARDAP